MAGAPAPLNSPFGNKPSSLPNPVPDDGMMQGEQSVMDIGKGFVPAPAAEGGPQQGQEAAPSGLDANDMALIEQLRGGAPAEPAMGAEAAPQPGDEFEQPGGFLEANAQQFRDLATRFQAGLAANDTEVMGLLKQKFGPENVRWRNGNAYFRKEGGGKFRPLDPEQFEIFSDLVPDMGRAVAQEAVATPAMLAGGAAAGPAGAVTARVLSVPAQIKAADAVAELFGVPQDAGRNRYVESVVQGSLETLAPFAARAVKGSAQYAAKFVPGTAARAGRLAQKEAANVFEMRAIDEQIARDSAELAEAGLIKKVPGAEVGFPEADVVLALPQLHPEHPYSKTIEAKLKGDGRYHNALQRHAQDIGSAVKENLRTIYSVAKAEGVDIGEQDLANVVTNAAEAYQKAEGKALASYKAQAMRHSKGARVPFPDEIKTQVADMATQLGFAVKQSTAGDRLVFTPPADMRKILGRNFGITDEGEARALVNVVNELIHSSANGQGLRVAQLDGITRMVGNMNKTARSASSTMGGAWGKLSSDLRTYKNQAIAQNLPDDVSREAFHQTMGKYGAIKEGVENLTNAINSDMSSLAVVRTVFNKGKQSLGELKAMKSLVGEASPETWEKLKGQWVEDLLMKHSAQGTMGRTGVNAQSLMKEINQQYGPEFMKVLYDGTGSNPQDLMKLLRVADRYNQTLKPVGQLSEAEKNIAVTTTIKAWLASKYVGANAMLAALGVAKGRNHYLLDALTQDGVEKYTKRLAPKQRVVATAKLKELLNTARVNGLMEQYDKVSHMVPRGFRQGINVEAAGGSYVPQESDLPQ